MQVQTREDLCNVRLVCRKWKDCVARWIWSSIKLYMQDLADPKGNVIFPLAVLLASLTDITPHVQGLKIVTHSQSHHDSREVDAQQCCRFLFRHSPKLRDLQICNIGELGWIWPIAENFVSQMLHIRPNHPSNILTPKPIPLLRLSRLRLQNIDLSFKEDYVLDGLLDRIDIPSVKTLELEECFETTTFLSCWNRRLLASPYPSPLTTLDVRYCFCDEEGPHQTVYDQAFDEIDNLLRAANSIKTLIVHCENAVLPSTDSIIRHAQTLKHLLLAHKSEDFGTNFIDTFALRIIMQACSHLEEVAFYLPEPNQDNTWTDLSSVLDFCPDSGGSFEFQSALDVIAAAPKLRTLRILDNYYKDTDDDNFESTVEEFARRVFNYLDKCESGLEVCLRFRFLDGQEPIHSFADFVARPIETHLRRGFLSRMSF